MMDAEDDSVISEEKVDVQWFLFAITIDCILDLRSNPQTMSPSVSLLSLKCGESILT